MKNTLFPLFFVVILNINHIYGQRFTNQDPFVNVTYKPSSLEEKSRIPLIKQKIANENYEKIESLRKELHTLREGIKINQDKYFPSIDGINSVLYELLLGNNDLADPEINKIIKMTTVFIDETVNKYNLDIRAYNEKKK